jgi:uridine kinase
LVSALCNHYGKDISTNISQDSYYKDISNLSFKQRTITNYDHPSSIDIDLFHENLTELKNGRVIEKPTYNFETHTRNPSFESISPKKLIFVEGTLIFHFRRLLNLMLMKVFLFAPEKIRYNRRIERDVSDRGRTVDSVIMQYKKTVLPMHQKYVEPTKSLADIHISGVNNIKISTKQVIQTIDRYL